MVLVMPFVYILECNDKTLYTGWTVDLNKRLQRHQKGIGAKYTRARLPVKLVYSLYLNDRTAAMQCEAFIKKLTREQKLELIEKQTIVEL